MNLQDINMTVEYTGFNTCKNMPNMNDYKITLAYNGNKIKVKYHMGLSHAIGDINLLDLLDTLIMDAGCGSVNWEFEEFCDNMGYEYDSRKAYKIYKDCNKLQVKLHKLFISDEIDSLLELIDNND